MHTVYMQHIVSYVKYCFENKQALRLVQTNAARLLASHHYHTTVSNNNDNEDELWNQLVFVYYCENSSKNKTIFEEMILARWDLWCEYGHELLLPLTGKFLQANGPRILEAAVKCGNLEAVRLLFSLHRALLHHVNKDGDYPLCWAVYQCDEMQVRLLLACGSKILTRPKVTNVLMILLLLDHCSLHKRGIIWDILIKELENIEKYVDDDAVWHLLCSPWGGYSVMEVLGAQHAARVVGEQWLPSVQLLLEHRLALSSSLANSKTLT